MRIILDVSSSFLSVSYHLFQSLIEVLLVHPSETLPAPQLFFLLYYHCYIRINTPITIHLGHCTSFPSLLTSTLCSAKIFPLPATLMLKNFKGSLLPGP